MRLGGLGAARGGSGGLLGKRLPRALSPFFEEDDKAVAAARKRRRARSREAAGIEEVILYFNVGGKPHAQVLEQMDRFMASVAPAFANR